MASGSPNLTVKVPYLGDLDSKEFSLGIPTENGNILIGATCVVADARLLVNVGDGIVRLSREDGMPIQIVEHGRQDNPDVPKADYVLSEPVDAITFKPAEESGHWTAESGGEPLEVEDPIGFASFAKTVAEHALTKQIEAAKEKAEAAA
jgi:hypothetical protein